MDLHIVYLESKAFLTKKAFNDWRETQDEFDDYKASFGPWSPEEVIEYFEWDYPEIQNFAAKVKQFVESEDETMEF